MKCREATYALFDNIVKQHTHFFDNVAKQHTHFFGMPHPFFETLAMSLRWDVKLLLNKSWPLLFYLWSSDGEAGRGGRILCGWLNVFSRWALFVRKGGSTIFFNPQRGGSSIFFDWFRGGSSIFFTFLWSSTMMKPSFCCLVPYLLISLMFIHNSIYNHYRLGGGFYK